MKKPPRGRLSLRETIALNQKAMDYYALMTDKPRVVLTAPPPPRERKPSVPSGNPTEAQVLKAVLAYVKHHPKVAMAWRQNSGTFQERNRDGSVRFIRANTQRGMSDIQGQLKDGRALAIEVKSRTGKVSPHQAEYLEKVRTNGGVSGVCRCVEDAIEMLERA